MWQTLQAAVSYMMNPLHKAFTELSTGISVRTCVSVPLDLLYLSAPALGVIPLCRQLPGAFALCELYVEYMCVQCVHV